MTSNPFLHLLELLEANVGGVLSEALTAHVEVILPVKDDIGMNKIKMVFPQTCTNLMRPWPLLQQRHFLDPCPYFLGRENQILS